MGDVGLVVGCAGRGGTVRVLEHLGACDCVLCFLAGVEDGGELCLGKLHVGEFHGEFFFVPVPVGTAVVFAAGGSWLGEDGAAVPGLVLDAGALETVVVAEVVAVVLVELVEGDVAAVGEGVGPELHGFVRAETDALEEQRELLAAVVSQVVVLGEAAEQVLDAERVVLGDLGGTYGFGCYVAVFVGVLVGLEVGDRVAGGEVLQDRQQPVVLVQLRQVSLRDDQVVGQFAGEFARKQV